jgi:hypothetical protein
VGAENLIRGLHLDFCQETFQQRNADDGAVRSVPRERYRSDNPIPRANSVLTCGASASSARLLTDGNILL